MTPGGEQSGDDKPPGRYGDLRLRAGFAVLFAAVGFGAILAGGWWSLAFAIFAGGVMAREWRRISLPQGRPVAAGFQIVAVAGAALITFHSGVEIAAVFLIAIAGAGATADAFLDRAPWWSLAGALYIGAAIALFVELREAPAQGVEAIIWLVLIVISTDVGAYFAGRTFGGPKLWRRVSPNKTWAGAVGGVLAAALTAYVVGLFAGRSLGLEAELLAMAVSAVSQAGDLMESAYKRRFGVKDSGRIMPGHGGLLDRFDGLLAASIAVGALYHIRPSTPVWAW